MCAYVIGLATITDDMYEQVKLVATNLTQYGNSLYHFKPWTHTHTHTHTHTDTHTHRHTHTHTHTHTYLGKAWKQY